MQTKISQTSIQTERHSRESQNQHNSLMNNRTEQVPTHTYIHNFDHFSSNSLMHIVGNWSNSNIRHMIGATLYDNLYSVFAFAFAFADTYAYTHHGAQLSDWVREPTSYYKSIQKIKEYCNNCINNTMIDTTQAIQYNKSNTIQYNAKQNKSLEWKEQKKKQKKTLNLTFINSNQIKIKNKIKKQKIGDLYVAVSYTYTYTYTHTHIHIHIET